MTTTTTRIGIIGETYEYTRAGRRIGGTDRETFDELLTLSATWPDTYHQWVSSADGHARWAYRGTEIAESALPF